MSPLLVALLGVQLLPLFIATWRTSLLGLACQGMIMGLIAHRLEPAPHSASAFIELVDLVLVRGVGVPLVLYTALYSRPLPARNDLIPPNLLSWTLALTMVLVSFTFAEHLVPKAGDSQMLVAVAAAGILLGFLVLATQSGPFSQMSGALRIENAIALLELGGSRHEAPLGVQLGVLGVFVATVAFFRVHLAGVGLGGALDTAPPPGADGPTL